MTIARGYTILGSDVGLTAGSKATAKDINNLVPSELFGFSFISLTFPTSNPLYFIEEPIFNPETDS